MYTIQKIQTHLAKTVAKALGHVVAVEDITTPPNADMGDFAVPLFKYAKKTGKNPAVLAHETAEKIKADGIIAGASAAGSYVNIKLNYEKLGPKIVDEIEKAGNEYGAHKLGKRKKVIVEYACPNVNKAFHIGHARNIITGEAIIRLLENANYDVVRVNYQGDVGMHIAKSLWGILHSKAQFEKIKSASLAKRIEFLGKAYAKGAKAYEEDEAAKAEIIDLNRAVYEKDKAVMPIWRAARKWSLQYFETIYKQFGSCFDHYFFESEMAERGVEIVRAGVKKGIFKESESAVIFEGSKYGLHDRVFINSAGFPTYEAKDLALAETMFKEIKPVLAIHVVGKEQAEYFKVVFKALEQTLPASAGKEKHVSYGWVHLKGGKMSSRLGNVVTGESLLKTVKQEIGKLAKKAEVKNIDKLAEDITIAAVKYAMLKVDVEKDVAFDMEESVSVSGNSGPYLLYTYARIKSILRKAGTSKSAEGAVAMTAKERQLLLQLAQFPEATRAAAESYNPSEIAKYLFDLAQLYNDYYHTTSVLQADDDATRAFRLQLSENVARVLARGCDLLGFAVVERM